ncbi:MAG: hypothetical protein K2N64_03525 [Anaeroplasmataceae bacterium]|nr:hypothetical protein [Anaeroplasmataceae bacterium]
MNEIVVGIIGLIGTLSSICFAYLAFRRNHTTDTKKDGKAEGVLISDIGYIKSSIDRMEGKLDKVETNYQDLLSRLIRVEEAQSSLEKRLEHSRGK